MKKKRFVVACERLGHWIVMDSENGHVTVANFFAKNARRYALDHSKRLNEGQGR